MSSYAKGQLVWAKIKGYPWWPAIVQIVSKPNQDKGGSAEKEVLVNFIGENSHAVLTYDKVADFTAKFKQHSTSKNKKLQDSIKVAQRIQSGESTYEEEREKLLASIAKAQASPETGEVKHSTRGRPSTKKKLEMAAAAAKEKEVSSKSKEAAVKGKEAVQKEKEKEKGPLYKFKEDVLGLQKKADTPQKEKPAVTATVKEKEKEVVHKEKDKAKDSRLTQKQKAKEKEKEKKRENEELQDYMPFRLTRSQLRRDPSETHAELDSASKNKKRGPKAGKKGSDSGADSKHPNKPARGKGRLLLDDDEDALDDYRNSRMQSHIEEKPEEEHMASPGKVSERKFSGARLDFEEEKNNPQDQRNVETSVSRASEGNKMELEIHTEQPMGSLKSLEAQASSTAESLGSGTNLNSKRSNSAIMKDYSPIYTTQVKERESTGMLGEAEYNEYITKKMKLGTNPGAEENKALDERVLGTEVYNVLLIKKFEENLSRILDRVCNKLQGTDRLKEYDVDMIKILEIIEEFENRVFNGSEFIGSDLGKILKTVHFLLVKNKTRLPKTGELVITALAKVLHKIKDRILKYCLDNSEYMDALKLPQEAAKPISMAAIDIDFEEIKAKIEEIGSETKVEAAPITTKIEEESTSAYSQVQKQPVQTAEPNPPKPVAAPPVQQTPPAVVAQPVTPSTREIPKESVKESPALKQSHSETNPNEITLLLRKKICQKLAKLLQRSYLMDKDKSQELTLRLEDKLNKFYLGNANEYKQAIKSLHKLIKVQNLKLDDLTHVLDMSVEQFKQMLKEKLPEVAEGHALADMNDNDLTPQDTSDLVRRESSMMHEDPSTFNFSAYLAEKMDNDVTLSNMTKRDEELRNKMLVEEPNSFIQDLLQRKEDKQ